MSQLQKNQKIMTNPTEAEFGDTALALVHGAIGAEKDGDPEEWKKCQADWKRIMDSYKARYGDAIKVKQ